MQRIARWQILGVVALAVAAVTTALVVGLLPGLSPAPATVKVDLTIAWNSTSQTYSYAPAAIHVPAGSTVAMTITNYDPGNHTAPSEYCHVLGTTGGMMSYRVGGGMMGSWMMHNVGDLPARNVSHTFSIFQGGFQLNVPIPAAANSATPAVVSFTFHAPGAGAMTWGCEAMGAGQMMGTFYSD